jgi:hypothetical protein
MLLQVIWVEHVEVAQTLPINMLYQTPVQSGGAFGAHRWVGALQRACDRFSSFSTLGLLHPDPYEGSGIRTCSVSVDACNNNACVRNVPGRFSQ